MIKVPTRDKFSKKTPFPFQSDSSKKNSQSRSSIIIQGQISPIHSSLFETERKIQSICTSRKTTFDAKNSVLNRKNSANQIQNHKLKKTVSIKASQQEIDEAQNLFIENKKNSSITNIDLNRIKIQENLADSTLKGVKQPFVSFNTQNALQYTNRKFSNLLQKPQSPFLNRNKMKKKSNFHHMKNGAPINQSEDNENLKLTNSNNLTINNVSKKIFVQDSQKQNEEKDLTRKKEIIGSKVRSKSRKLKFLKRHKKENISSTNILKSKSSNDLKVSSSLTPKFQPLNYKEIFQGMTQKNLSVNQIDVRTSMEQTFANYEAGQKFQNVDFQQQQEDLEQGQNSKSRQERIDKEHTEQLFRQLQREIASKEEIEQFHNKSSNFYEKLRLKLMKQYDRISKDYRLDEKEKDKIGLLIEGCNLQKHRRVNNFYLDKKQFDYLSRANDEAINQATRDIQNLDFVNKERNKIIMRPPTSKTKSISSKMGQTLPDKSSNMFSDYITILTRQQTEKDLNKKKKNTFNRFQDLDSDCIFDLTNPDLKRQRTLRHSMNDRPSTCRSKNTYNLRNSESMSRRQDILKKQKSQLASKFEALIGICNGENDEHRGTKKKMKMFEYYCKKIDVGFEKLSDRITDYVSKL